MFLFILRVIRAYLESHEKHCSQISVSTCKVVRMSNFTVGYVLSHNLIKVSVFIWIADLSTPLVYVASKVQLVDDYLQL